MPGSYGTHHRGCVFFNTLDLARNLDAGVPGQGIVGSVRLSLGGDSTTCGEKLSVATRA